MLLKINGPKKYFWQWDKDRQLIVDDDTCGEVHFCNGTTDCALVCEIYQRDGLRLVNVPNVLLQTDKALTAYLYLNGGGGCQTRHQQTFAVVARNKPADYIYTETEVKSWESLDERVRALEQGGGGSVSSDWNAAEGEPGHVLNRTHWTETVLTPIVEDKSYALVAQTNPPATTYPKTAAKQEINNLPKYETVVVIFDGVTYECPVVPKDDGGCYVGNYDVAEGAEYPFYFGVIKNKLSGNFLQVRAAEGTYHTASIYGKEEIVHKIDPKYLPETSTNGGISSTEKSLLLSLFKNAAYTADMSATIAQLETLWSGGDVPDEPVVPDLPEADVTQTGSILSIVSGVTATQSGNVLAIA